MGKYSGGCTIGRRMKSFYIFIVLIFIFHLNSISGQSYVHRQREPPHHEQMSYISPVTYQAKASFGTPENVVTQQIIRETVRHHLPRELVVRRQVPVTYQTYDRRALGVQEPVAGKVSILVAPPLRVHFLGAKTTLLLIRSLEFSLNCVT